MAEPTATPGDTTVVAQVAQPVQTQAVQPVVPTTPAVAPVAPADAGLPQDASARTREQFDKVLESNRILTDLLLKNQQIPAQPAQPAQVPTEPNMADFTKVNPITGEEYIDKEKLTRALTGAAEAAKKSQEAAQNAIAESRRVAEEANRREIERQEKETFAVYPELDRRDKKFDERFEKQVRGVLLDSYVNATSYGGRPLSFVEAARFVKEVAPEVTPTVQPTPGTGAQPAVVPTAQEQKQQATVSVPSQPQQVLPSVNTEEMARLALQTRLGTDGDKALAERLKFTEHILPPGGERQGGE